MVPQLLVEGLLHLWNELQRRRDGELGAEDSREVAFNDLQGGCPSPISLLLLRPGTDVSVWPGVEEVE